MRLSILIGIGLCFGILLLPHLSDITGRAVQTFSASATVTIVNVNVSEAMQSAPPMTHGDHIDITLPIAYEGAGMVQTSINTPAEYPGCIQWTVDDGTLKNVTVAGNSLSWLANLSAGSGSLICDAPPPVLTVDSADTGDTSYSLGVSVSSENHMTNVTANTTIDTRYGGFALFENNTDVTALYNFTVAGSTATWSGFSLSTREFTITGGKAASGNAAAVSTGSGGGFSTPMPLGLAIIPQRLFVTGVPGKQVQSTILITEQDRMLRRVTLTTTASWISVPNMLVIEPESSRAVSVVVTVPVERSEGRVRIAVGKDIHDVFVTVTPLVEEPSSAALATPVQEAPRLLRWWESDVPAAVVQYAERSDALGFVNILLIAVALGLLLVWAHKER